MSEPLVLPVTETVIQSRFSDTDAVGHISALAYTSYTEVGRSDLFKAIHEREPLSMMLVMVRLDQEYVGEAFYGDPIRVTTACQTVGTKSITLDQRIFSEERLLVTARAVLVGFDTETRQSVALPAHWRASPVT